MRHYLYRRPFSFTQILRFYHLQGPTKMDDGLLYPIVCIQFIPHYVTETLRQLCIPYCSDSSPQILTHIIVSAYRRSFLSPHRLYVVEDDDNIESYATSASNAHFEYDTSAFHGKTIDDIICILQERVTGNTVAKNVFYIADDRTIRDHSLLLVHVQPKEKDQTFFSVRLACEFVNLMARSFPYPESRRFIQDFQNDVDDDGVYRGGRKDPYIYCGTRTSYLDEHDALEQGELKALSNCFPRAGIHLYLPDV